MPNKQTIYISAYPKSGSTWLTRLLADVLNSPSGGCMPEEDAKEIATEGQDRPGPYIVRKGHFLLIDDDGSGSIVPRPHQMAWKRLTDERIVFLVRDPRDICVSGAWHWNKSTDQKDVEQFLERMIKGDVARRGRWDEFCKSYSQFNECINFVLIKYEHLLKNPAYILDNSLKWLHLIPISSMVTIEGAIQRQSLATRKAQLDNDPKELRRNNMRKGIAGDWRNHFTPQMNERMWDEFGWMMERLGYEK